MEHLIELTADGSPTLFVPALDEHYHSVKGARTESVHIFIDMGLRACPLPAPRVLEVGFGTGLNALLTWDEAERTGRPVRYTTLELYPLSVDEALALGYEGAAGRLRALHEAEWEMPVELSPHFTLRKCRADFTTCSLPAAAFDLVYFDAFAPDKQPAMWSEERFATLFAALSPGGIQRRGAPTFAARRLHRRASAGPSGGQARDIACRQASLSLFLPASRTTAAPAADKERASAGQEPRPLCVTAKPMSRHLKKRFSFPAFWK